MPRPLFYGERGLSTWSYDIIPHLENIGVLPRNKPPKQKHVSYVGGAAQVAHVERQDFDSRGRSPRQREGRIKMSAEDGRIAR